MRLRDFSSSTDRRQTVCLFVNGRSNFKCCLALHLYGNAGKPNLNCRVQGLSLIERISLNPIGLFLSIQRELS